MNGPMLHLNMTQELIKETPEVHIPQLAQAITQMSGGK
jgi:hypothetical protein